MNKQELLERMRVGRERLEAALAGMDEDQFSAPGTVSPGSAWSYKDLLAHLGYWEDRAAQLFQDLLEGKNPPKESRSYDEINLEVYTRNRGLPSSEVRGRELAAYQRLLEMVAGSSEADLFDPQRFSWANGDAFVEWIAGNSYGHYEEHGIAANL